MPQVTVSVSHEKLPLLKDVLSALGIEDVKLTDFLPRTYTTNVSRSIKDSASNIYKKYFTWEYYSNELEYE